MTYNKQETTHSEKETTYNNLNLPIASKRGHKTTNNKQILGSFYSMRQSVLFFNTLSSQHLITIIRALLHGESW